MQKEVWDLPGFELGTKGVMKLTKFLVKVGRATHQAMGVFGNVDEIKQVNKLLFYPRIARSWDSWKSSDLPLSYLVAFDP